ncbi:ABC transporter substrate-binding protein [Micromonospora sp. Llam0]|uniref:ABC transporter substrate-binding protein n=1 Tax=Micromonospora sp. Llam0 TaxID=2485143 RepID=UPI000F46C584|nr:ABC transporter substrate-binding protein [Micromonospora sp. Llam0]
MIGLGATAVATPLLTACTGGDGTAATLTRAGDGEPTGTPHRGGTVRLAFAGGGANESLDPTVGTTPVELARFLLVYDQLFVFADGSPQPALALKAEPGAGGTDCTLTLRTDVTWHDGSPFTAADVVHTFKHRAAPDRQMPSELSMYFNLAAARATGTHTVVVPTIQPVGDPATVLASAGLMVIKEGTAAFETGKVVGTGPYQLTAYQAGSEARLSRVETYWDGPGYADEIVLLSLDDPAARVNAVRGGQADYASDIPYATAKSGSPGAGLQIRAAAEKARTTYGFVLNMTRPLIKDPRVRTALRTGIDRQALVDAVFLGYGAVANDLFGYGAKYFVEGVDPVARDVAKAKQLIEQAGAAGKPFVVRTAEYEVGLNSSAELWVAQLKELGLDARVDIVGLTEYFDQEGLATADAVTFPLGPFSLSVTYTRSAAFEALAFPDDELKTAVAVALAATVEQERAEAWATAQKVMTDRGNWIAWGRGDVLSVARENLTGLLARESPKYPWLGKTGFTG